MRELQLKLYSHLPQRVQDLLTSSIQLGDAIALGIVLLVVGMAI